ncbi:MAG: hypothetical protein Q9221_007932 [Calogaya cf. arnoldii]
MMCLPTRIPDRADLDLVRSTGLPGFASYKTSYPTRQRPLSVKIYLCFGKTSCLHLADMAIEKRIVLRGCSIIAALVLVINVVATVYFKLKWKTTGDLGTIFRGQCSKAQQLSSRLHIVINILSTTLLSISNVCMQLLAAPTRQDIDEAHSKFLWLDIGVPSFRNLWHINRKRRVILVLLAATSIPLHFLWV